jgi:hypothetical protein
MTRRRQVTAFISSGNVNNDGSPFLDLETDRSILLIRLYEGSFASALSMKKGGDDLRF